MSETRASLALKVTDLTAKVRQLEAALADREKSLTAVSGTKDACQFAIVNLREELAAQKAKAEAALAVAAPLQTELTELREQYDTLAVVAIALARKV